jgi:hypothetical protein
MTGILNALLAAYGAPTSTTVEYLVIAGGGGGGDRGAGASGGGGGAGGYRTNYTSSGPTPTPKASWWA